MRSSENLVFKKKVSVLSFYLKGLMVHHGGKENGVIPRITAQQRNLCIKEDHLRRYEKACGLQMSNTIPLLYPHTIIFPLHMAILSRPLFPLLYYKMLQIRNRTELYRSITMDEVLDVTCRIGPHRYTGKGLEVDFESFLVSGEETVWQNVNTYFFRNVGPKSVKGENGFAFSTIDSADMVKEWCAPSGGGWEFSRLSGDYNGIHYIGLYARMFGFKGAFCHGQAAVAQCLNHLPLSKLSLPLRVDTALKGPIYYKKALSMYCKESHKGYRFDLFCGNNTRPGIQGNIISVNDARLFQEDQDFSE